MNYFIVILNSGQRLHIAYLLRLKCVFRTNSVFYKLNEILLSVAKSQTHTSYFRHNSYYTRDVIPRKKSLSVTDINVYRV